MSFKATQHNEGDVAVLKLEGNITIGEAAGSLREAVKGLFTVGTKNVVLDLGGVHYIDSAGLGELVGCYATAEKNGGKLKLLNLQKKVEGLMQITKLITVFDVYDDEAAAIRSFHTTGAAGA
jgi:anti-sigma B factor antagonist